MADITGAALGLVLSGSLALLIGWHLRASWREGKLPNRNGTVLRKGKQPRSFAFWFGFEALSFVGLVAVSAFSAWRLLSLLLSGSATE